MSRRPSEYDYPWSARGIAPNEDGVRLVPGQTRSSSVVLARLGAIPETYSKQPKEHHVRGRPIGLTERGKVWGSYLGDSSWQLFGRGEGSWSSLVRMYDGSEGSYVKE